MKGISIIIPTRDRAKTLYRALTALSKASHDGIDFEVIVVDNASQDETAASVEKANNFFVPGQVKYFCEPMPGLLSGRHRGALEAGGEICAFIDDDVLVGLEWLNALEQAFRDPANALVGGPSRPLFECNPPDWLADFYWESEYGRHCGWLSLLDAGEGIKEIDPSYVWGLNFAIRKTILFDLGGFHPDSVPKALQRFQGDGETGLTNKIREAGFEALYHPQMAVEHVIPAARLTLSYFDQRSYYQGVCDSYTQIRAKRAVEEPTQSWKEPLRRIKRIFNRAVGSTALLNEAERRTTKAYQAGSRFHWNEAKRDPKLLEWVCRDNYFDYRLPDDWQKYL